MPAISHDYLLSFIIVHVFSCTPFLLQITLQLSSLHYVVEVKALLSNQNILEGKLAKC